MIRLLASRFDDVPDVVRVRPGTVKRRVFFCPAEVYSIIKWGYKVGKSKG